MLAQDFQIGVHRCSALVQGNWTKAPAKPAQHFCPENTRNVGTNVALIWPPMLGVVG